MSAFITDAGAALIAMALANGTQINLTQMAVGTGGGAGAAAQAALQAEVYRGGINALLSDPLDNTIIIAEMRIGTNDGGWTVNEAGIFTDSGVLFALADTVDIVKPAPVPDQPTELLIRFAIQMNSPAVVSLDLDPAVLASRAWVLLQVPPPWDWIRTPILLAPTQGAQVQEAPFLVTAPYYHLYGVPHAASQYQVRLATDTDWTSPLYDSGDSTDLAVHRMPLGNLTVSLSYEWRVRFSDDEGLYSRWSETGAFTTPAVFNAVQAPAIIAPLNNAQDVVFEGLNLSAGAFAVSPGADTHATSQFQVRLATDTDWATPLYDSGAVPAALTHAVPDGTLAPDTDYVWRVSYAGTVLGAGAWSSDAGFTTKVPSGEWLFHTSMSFPAAGAAQAADVFVVPADVTRIQIFVLGATGGGVSWNDVSGKLLNNGGFGGAALKTLAVSPGDTFSALIGSGGLGGVYSGGASGNGGSSSLTGPGVSISATGGAGGQDFISSGAPGLGAGGDTNGDSTTFWAANPPSAFGLAPGRNGGATGHSTHTGGYDGDAGAVQIVWGPGI